MADRNPNPARELELYRVPEAPARPTAVLVLDSLGRMRPATAVALVVTVGGLLAGAAVAVVSLAAALVVAALALGGMVAVALVSLAVVVLVLERRR